MSELRPYRSPFRMHTGLAIAATAFGDPHYEWQRAREKYAVTGDTAWLRHMLDYVTNDNPPPSEIPSGQENPGPATDRELTVLAAYVFVFALLAFTAVMTWLY